MLNIKCLLFFVLIIQQQQTKKIPSLIKTINRTNVKLTEEKLRSIINNFDGFNEHCVPYSLYIKKDNFDFIGTLENFYEDWKNISDIHIEHMTERQNFDNKVQKDPKTKKFVKVDNKKIEDMHNTVIKKYSNELSRLYSGDFALYSKVTK